MKLKINALLVAILIGAVFSVTPPVFAAPTRPTVQGLGKEVREGISSAPGAIKAFIRGRAAVGTGSVTAINGTTITITKDSKTYTVLTDTNTQFRRRFWGKSSLAEISVGDTVNVIGQWTDEGQTTIQARLVRDISIQLFNGVFFGTVQSLTSNGWVMATVARGDQTVTVSSGTKFTDRKGGTLTQSGITVGHKVRVRGLWDRKAGTISEVTAVKDFSLPVVATPTPKVTPTPTP